MTPNSEIVVKKVVLNPEFSRNSTASRPYKAETQQERSEWKLHIHIYEAHMGLTDVKGVVLYTIARFRKRE